MLVLEHHLFRVVVVMAPEARSGLSPGVLKTLSGLVSQRSGMDRLLFHLRSGWWPAGTNTSVGAGRRESRWLHRHHPPQAEAGVGSGGPRPPRRPQREEAAPLPEGWRPALAVAGIPRWRGLGLMRSSPTLPTWTSLKPRGRGTNEGGRASRLGRILELVDLHTVPLHRDGILA